MSNSTIDKNDCSASESEIAAGNQGPMNSSASVITSSSSEGKDVPQRRGSFSFQAMSNKNSSLAHVAFDDLYDSDDESDSEYDFNNRGNTCSQGNEGDDGHRAYQGGFAAAAYEAAREDFFKRKNQQDKVEAVEKVKTSETV